MIKMVMALGGAALAALATVLTVALAGSPSPVATVSTLPPAAAEISGPCDEAEHAADPRCTGSAAAGRAEDDEADDRAEDRQDDDDAEDRADARREAGEDVRGSCDEAEHAGDPRCMRAATSQQPETRGEDDDRGTDDHGDDDDRSGYGGRGGNDDRSGSNPGRG